MELQWRFQIESDCARWDSYWLQVLQELQGVSLRLMTDLRFALGSCSSLVNPVEAFRAQ